METVFYRTMLALLKICILTLYGAQFFPQATSKTGVRTLELNNPAFVHEVDTDGLIECYEVVLTSIVEPPISEVLDDRIYVNGTEFLVKGIDYAPWLKKTGPDPYRHDPFPDEYDDVTSEVDSVPDYSRDGIIETWEVIEYDLSVMKSVGANTIRTYASGVWHDKDLDGVKEFSGTPEESEFVQGDVPDWVYKRIIDFAQKYDMKVIMGYWVQEEDFALGLECNFDDLEVAKDTMTRVISNYGNCTSVIAWAIGNEVSGSWNHEWFDWTVSYHDYLNQLYSHIREVDYSRRPIMYSKYVGEDFDFENFNVEIMAINAYVHPAEDLGDEFLTPAVGSRAYLIGEFGHNIEHAVGHWNLSREHAGGCFLEYNDVWWKGSDNYFGIVDANRSVNCERYEVLRELFKVSVSVADITSNQTWVPDNKVDMRDVAIVALRFGHNYGMEQYDVRADITGPGYIIPDGKIDMRDVALVCKYFGELY